MRTNGDSMVGGKVSALVYGAVAVVGWGASPAFAQQWPGWGGPHANFVADAAGLAKEWPESGPKQLWKRALGEGYSAIVVDGGRLYTMYRGEDREIVICLDAKTGETVWEHKYDAKPAEGHEHGFGDGPRSTPLLWGDRLYTVGVSGVMHCLDKADGKVKWSADLWKDFGGSFLNHGYASSPVRYGNTVIALNGGQGSSIIAFDKDDGHVAWKALDFKNSYSTPVFIQIDGKDQMITFMANEIIGVDPKNGDLKWRYEHGNQWGQNVCPPIWNAANNILFFSSPEAGARALKLTSAGDKTNVEELWSTRKIQFYHVTSVALGDYVFGSTGTMGPTFFAAVNLKDGKIAWRERDFAKATCVYADGRFIILDENGQLGLASASPEGFSVHSKATVLEKAAWTVPSVVGKTLYARDKKNLVALDLG